VSTEYLKQEDFRERMSNGRFVILLLYLLGIFLVLPAYFILYVIKRKLRGY
jgi:hypothetical protein